MDIFETLNKLSKKESKDNQDPKGVSIETPLPQHSKRKQPCYIFRDEETNQIKERPLSKLDSAGSALINKVVKKKQNPAKLIRDSLNID